MQHTVPLRGLGQLLYMPCYPLSCIYIYMHVQVRDKWLGWWSKVDEQLGKDLSTQVEEQVTKAAKAFAPAAPGKGGVTGGIS